MTEKLKIKMPLRCARDGDPICLTDARIQKIGDRIGYVHSDCYQPEMAVDAAMQEEFDRCIQSMDDEICQGLQEHAFAEAERVLKEIRSEIESSKSAIREIKSNIDLILARESHI